jgi:VWFA-related protein
MNARLVSLAIVPLIGLTATARQATFQTSVSSIALDVSVKRDGKPVQGLTARDFRLTDRGVPQTVTDVSQQQLPVDVTFIPDLAGTVEGPWLEGFRRAFATLQRSLRDGDRARLVTFTPRIQEVQEIQFGTVGFKGAQGPADGGATSLNDTVAVSLVRDSSPDYRRMAILMTDGQDGGSFLDEPELFEVVTRTDVTVFVVALTDGTSRVPQRPTNERMLQQLADATGGALTIVQRDADLGASFVRELENFRTSYVLRYTPTGVEAVGWHEVEVGLNRTGRFEVRARKGYFGEVRAAGR